MMENMGVSRNLLEKNDLKHEKIKNESRNVPAKMKKIWLFKALWIIWVQDSLWWAKKLKQKATWKIRRGHSEKPYFLVRPINTLAINTKANDQKVWEVNLDCLCLASAIVFFRPMQEEPSMHMIFFSFKHSRHCLFWLIHTHKWPQHFLVQGNIYFFHHRSSSASWQEGEYQRSS